MSRDLVEMVAEQVRAAVYSDSNVSCIGPNHRPNALVKSTMLRAAGLVPFGADAAANAAKEA